MRLIDADAAVLDARANYGGVHDAVLMEHFLNSQPTIAPSPNDPLTPDELREMDGEPVWVIFYAAYMETVGMWALVSVEGYTKEVFLTNRLGGRSAYEKAAVDIKAIYRRKPEEGTK